MARPAWKSAGYQIIKNFFWVMAVIFFRFRWHGREYFPKEGNALICCNHQSYFDPVLVGICFRQPLSFMARKTLFDSFPFGVIIRYLDAIPIDQDGMGIGGFKESLRRLKRGEILVVFPEGSRTEDGEVGPFKPGFTALARRGKAPILPAAVDGAYDAWPRNQRFPRPTRLRTVFGPQISVEEIKQLSDEELVEELRNRIIACHAQARQFRGK